MGSRLVLEIEGVQQLMDDRRTEFADMESVPPFPMTESGDEKQFLGMVAEHFHRIFFPGGISYRGFKRNEPLGMSVAENVKVTLSVVPFL